MFAQPGMGYDRAITIFSPDGRLFQVEYAIEAVRRGTTAIGIKTAEGVVLAVEKRVMTLQDPGSVEKIFVIDQHVGAAIAGLTADARILINQARIEAQINRLSYDEIISIETLTKKICDLKQLYTQHAGVRPFGVSLLIAGVDADGPKLFMTDPSGAYWGYKAQAIGAGAQTVKEMLEKEYKENLTLDASIKLALKALKQVIETEFSFNKLEIAVVKTEDRLFKILEPKEVKSYVESL
ncbi:MAG: archaeal proteasome endopeptidase complex subunit alpha [Candidatus Odinarchaeum yellowstonii]|jgi:proteasome alpha subunit|uniref:Proteasome subunit alpha n=1 Tax=Odinarchaeota yellowstonii (strain LCB_4) TaxID=1841599 RepID=A0AAF0D159_ODILC|nr:MAG: archaeal proteasome endopeptidase complex subunit alpha [Candidatus Odinarchaeum yellowstonii]